MSGQYAGFILGSYGAAVLILGGMVLSSVLSYRAAKARLARIDRAKDRPKDRPRP